MTDPLLTVENLKTYFDTDDGVVRAVDDVSLVIGRGRTLGLVGESGSGKSVTAMSIIRLVSPPGRLAGGRITLHGTGGEPPQVLTELPESEMRRVRGGRISMIFQEPMTSLNPVFTVGWQIMEAIRLHQHVGRAEAQERAIANAVQSADSRTPAAGRRLSAPVFGWDAATGDDRHGAGLFAAAADRRRTDHGARRDDSGPNPRPAAGLAGGSRHVDPDDHARSGYRGRNGRRRGRDVRLESRRTGSRGRSVRSSVASLHGRAVPIAARAGKTENRATDHDSRHGPQPATVSGRLQVPSALCVCPGYLSGRGARAAGDCAGAFGPLPLCGPARLFEATRCDDSRHAVRIRASTPTRSASEGA